MENFHIGSLIRQKVAEQNFTVKDFAKAIHCSRTNAYSIFKRKRIDMEMLELVSHVLDFDFITEVYLHTESNRCLGVIETTADKLRQIVSDPEIFVVKTWTVQQK